MNNLHKLAIEQHVYVQTTSYMYTDYRVGQNK